MWWHVVCNLHGEYNEEVTCSFRSIEKAWEVASDMNLSTWSKICYYTIIPKNYMVKELS